MNAEPTTARLIAGASDELAAADPGDSLPRLVALHERPTREVFDAAAAMLDDPDPFNRELGARILRELGPAGSRPFRDETVPLLAGRLRAERDPRVLQWVISALGYHEGREALADLLGFAAHSDVGVRFHLAAALPGMAGTVEVLDVLEQLAGDADADVRFYALYVLVEELPAPPEQVARVCAARWDDSDEQVRGLARR